MTAEHTPGPWFVGDQIFDNEGVGELVIQRDTPHGAIAVAVAIGGLAAQGANARLIAAAPTMYEYIASSASNGCVEASKILEAIHAGR